MFTQTYKYLLIKYVLNKNINVFEIKQLPKPQ